MCGPLCFVESVHHSCIKANGGPTAAPQPNREKEAIVNTASDTQIGRSQTQNSGQFRKGQGGRPKGAKNKKTLARAAAIEDAKARVAVARTIKCDAAYDAKITPKEVLLQTMRNAWHDHKGLRAEAILADEVAQQCWEDARALTRGAAECDAVFKARKQAALHTAEHAQKKAREARQAAAASLNLALECATKAAPYEHPRLATATAQSEPVTVILKRFDSPRS
jgi:hypothetical protein